ncbi:unnamed protein product [Cuscuta europaea]|uniref:Uncharacterized protein n=1 Tax=Cuscuta europaea TaxID=41803 RepID=A0A9P0ZAI9_CUSEU|nr:unnamed protein product [Cuscuta europaea]
MEEGLKESTAIFFEASVCCSPSELNPQQHHPTAALLLRPGIDFKDPARSSLQQMNNPTSSTSNFLSAPAVKINKRMATTLEESHCRPTSLNQL